VALGRRQAGQLAPATAQLEPGGPQQQGMQAAEGRLAVAPWPARAATQARDSGSIAGSTPGRLPAGPSANESSMP
jgi:hypothetical protein